MLGALIFALNITAPNMALMALGVWLKRRGMTDNFIQNANTLVFNYALPSLLFFSVIDSPAHYGDEIWLIIAGILVTFVLFIGAQIYAKFCVADEKDKGVFVQGVFRSNMAIISL